MPISMTVIPALAPNATLLTVISSPISDVPRKRR